MTGADNVAHVAGAASAWPLLWPAGSGHRRHISRDCGAHCTSHDNLWWCTCRLPCEAYGNQQQRKHTGHCNAQSVQCNTASSAAESWREQAHKVCIRLRVPCGQLVALRADNGMSSCACTSKNVAAMVSISYFKTTDSHVYLDRGDSWRLRCYTSLAVSAVPKSCLTSFLMLLCRRDSEALVAATLYVPPGTQQASLQLSNPAAAEVVAAPKQWPIPDTIPGHPGMQASVAAVGTTLLPVRLPTC